MRHSLLVACQFNGTAWLWTGQGFGYGQTWQNVTASRAGGTLYYNTTSRPITVSLSAAGFSGTTWTVTVDGNAIARMLYSSGVGEIKTLQVIVPPGSSYSSSLWPSLWFELR